MTNVFNAQNQGIYAQGNPPYTEVTRSGVGWNIQTATAFTPVAAVPTVTTALELFNNTQGPGAITMVIDSLFGFQLLSTAAAQTYGLWAQVTTQKAAPANTALSVFSHSGRPTYATTAAGRIISAINTTVVANGWRPWGPVQAWGTAAATPGNSLVAEVNGRILVPPGTSLCVTVAGSIATASSFQVGVSWYELLLLNVP